ncbi:Uncharacterised protein [Paenibacillus thiaminolyticus]|nr:Uncharacterised protein [Paenibacillus thiaminolyticus]
MSLPSIYTIHILCRNPLWPHHVFRYFPRHALLPQSSCVPPLQEPCFKRQPELSRKRYTNPSQFPFNFPLLSLQQLQKNCKSAVFPPSSLFGKRKPANIHQFRLITAYIRTFRSKYCILAAILQNRYAQAKNYCIFAGFPQLTGLLSFRQVQQPTVIAPGIKKPQPSPAHPSYQKKTWPRLTGSRPSPPASATHTHAPAEALTGRNAVHHAAESITRPQRHRPEPGHNRGRNTIRPSQGRAP